jgi:hypothetical protein
MIGVVMSKLPGTLCRTLTLVGLLLAVDIHLACAESEFERGFREGYSKGYQDSLNAGKSIPAKPQSGAPPGIVVVRAWYGDDHKSCDLTAWAAKHFNSRTSADVEVTNEICGDPSPGNRKSLRVEFLCNGQTRTEEAYEHRQLSLRCY